MPGTSTLPRVTVIALFEMLRIHERQECESCTAVLVYDMKVSNGPPSPATLNHTKAGNRSYAAGLDGAERGEQLTGYRCGGRYCDLSPTALR